MFAPTEEAKKHKPSEKRKKCTATYGISSTAYGMPSAWFHAFSLIACPLAWRALFDTVRYRSIINKRYDYIMSNYYDDYDDYDYDDYDYDPWDHMTNDPVDFAMHGYGGFGYDTSHIQQDEKQSEMCIAASKGDLNTVKQLVNTAAAISDDEKHKVINYALRWTEVDYRMSGFTKEYEWFDLTPVASAAKMGHHEVVEYLLREGADPLLEGYPEDDKESLCAMFCALRHRNGLKMKKTRGPTTKQCAALP